MSTCIITGTTKDLQDSAVGGKLLRFTPLSVTNALIHTATLTVTSSDVEATLGEFSVTLIRGVQYNVKGFFLNFDSSGGKNVTIPDSSTVTLVSLMAASAVPDEGLTILSDGAALSTLIGTFNFSSAFDLTESPSGQINVDISGSGILSLGGLTGAAQTLATGSTGTDFAIVSSGTTHTFNLPTASALNRGLLSTSDWSTFNNKASTGYVDAALAALVDSSPGTLNTLNELAAALGDDANFAATVSTSIGTKLAKASNLSDLIDAAAARTNLGLIIGTNVQAFNQNLADLAGLADPNADRLLFWDDSASAYKHLTLGTNLSITDTTLDAAGGGGAPGGSTGDLQYNNGGAFAASILKQDTNLIEQRNGTNAQMLRVYSTYTNSSNYARLTVDAGASYALVGIQQAGTGGLSNSVFYLSNGAAGGSIQFQTGGSGRWNMASAGHLLANDDNVYDIGALGATRPRAGYFGTSVRSPLYNFSTTLTPSGSADSQGATGDMRYDDGFVYVKVSTGWKRATLATF